MTIVSVPGMTLCSPDGTPTGFVVPAAWSPCGTISIGWTPTLELETKKFQDIVSSVKVLKLVFWIVEWNNGYLTTFAAWAIAADMVIGSVLRTDAAAAAAATGPPPLK